VTAPPPPLRPLSLGEVLDVGFGLYRSRFPTLLVVAVACQLIPAVFSLYLQQSGAFLALEHPGLFLGYYLLAVVLNSIGVAATTIIVSDAYLGRETSATEAMSRTGPVVFRLIIISILSSLLMFFGFLLLIFPGLILLSGLALSSVAMVVELPARATDAMRRSWQLSLGYRFKIFGAIVLAGLLFLAPSLAIAGIWGALGSAGNGLSARVVGELIQILVYPYFYTVLTLLYYDLRVRKEGFDLEVLSASMQPA
jgi:Uncharacterised protein family (UPF0259)